MYISNKTNFRWKICVFRLDILFEIYRVMPLSFRDKSLFLLFIPDSAIEKISMNLIQAFSPPNKVRMLIYPTLAGWG